MISKH